MGQLYTTLKSVAAAAALTIGLSGGALAKTTTMVDLGPAGSGGSVGLSQPSLALTPLIQTGGPFEDIGKVKWFGGDFVPSGYMRADGSVLPVAQQVILFSKLGVQYGGDGRSTFALPDLRGRAIMGTSSNTPRGTTLGAVSTALTAANLAPHAHITNLGVSTTTGGGAPFDIRQPSLALDTRIITQGAFPSRGGGAGAVADDTIGFVYHDAAIEVPDPGTAPTDGASQSIAQNPALFSLLGTTFGGNGRTTFDLPDTTDRLLTGAGSGAGLSPRQLGQTMGSDTQTMDIAQVPAHVHSVPDGSASIPAGGGQALSLIQPEITFNYLIALQGYFPGRGGTTPIAGDNFIGEIALFGGNFAPNGWAFAQGQLLQISQFQALFSILGTQFGGDGRSTFALPDLRGRVPVGADNFYRVGSRFGTETAVLSQQQMPIHTHQVAVAAPVPLPLPAALLGAGLFCLVRVGRQRHG